MAKVPVLLLPLQSCAVFQRQGLVLKYIDVVDRGRLPQSTWLRLLKPCCWPDETLRGLNVWFGGIGRSGYRGRSDLCI